MNMIDVYLKMNSCERDKNNEVYFVDPMDNTKKEHLGRIRNAEVKDGLLNLDIVKKNERPIKFLNIVVNLDDIKTEE